MSWSQSRPLRLPLFLFEYIFFPSHIVAEGACGISKRAERRWRYFHFQEAKHGNYFVSHISSMTTRLEAKRHRDGGEDHEAMNL